MFENIEVLSKEKHGDLKLSPAAGFGFARELTIAPVSAKEALHAAKFYPIVFSKDGSPKPQALLSLEKGRNSFVDEDGKWTVAYIPLHVQRYPFILTKTADDEKYAICIDMDAPHLKEGGGESLFTADGEPAEILVRAQAILTQYQQDLVAGEQLLKALGEQDVLAEQQFSIKSGDKQATIAGFRGVDQEKLIELDDAILAEWVRNGLMGLVFAHLRSLENVRTLALEPQPDA